MRTSAEVSNIAFNCLANVISEMCGGRLKALLHLRDAGDDRPTEDVISRSPRTLGDNCRFPLSSAATGVELHGGKVRGQRGRDFLRLPQTGSHIVRRSDRASRLLQDRIRRAPEMAE